METRYPHVVRAVNETPWAMLPEKLAVITELIQLRASGVTFSEDEIRARIGADEFQAAERGRRSGSGAIAVIPIMGVINQRMNLMSAMSGGTSTELVSAAVRAAAADESIKAIVLDIDSPGGGVFGVDELATEIFKARGRKPIVAVANSMAASAAYWIGSAASELVVTPSGQVGSIGVFATHVDISKQEEMVGEHVTLIAAGKFKVESNPFQPLEDGARDEIQRKVDDYYGMFVGAVARNRGVTDAVARSEFGQGRMVMAKEAVKRGMADRVGTFDQTLARLGSGETVVLAPAAEGGDEAFEARGMRFVEESERVLASAQGFISRAEALAAYRAEQDRRLSHEKLGRLDEVAAELGRCEQALRSLVAAQEPAAREVNVAGLLAQFEYERQRAQRVLAR